MYPGTFSKHGTLLLLVGSALVLASSSSVLKKSVASSCLPPCFCSFSLFCYIASDFLTRLGAPGDRDHTYLSSYLTCQCLYPESEQCLWNQVNLTSPFLILCLQLYWDSTRHVMRQRGQDGVLFSKSPSTCGVWKVGSSSHGSQCWVSECEQCMG